MTQTATALLLFPPACPTRPGLGADRRNDAELAVISSVIVFKVNGKSFAENQGRPFKGMFSDMSVAEPSNCLSASQRCGYMLDTEAAAVRLNILG